jgi:molecular chaperone HscB
MDPFDTLGVPPSFSLSLEDLATRQRDLSWALHPDRFVGRPASERRAALGRAIEVNEAHRTLKNPLTRAEALLGRLGLSLHEGQEPPASPEFLMEMMDLREDLRTAGRSQNAAEVQRLAARVREQEAALAQKLSSCFEAAQDNKQSPDAVKLEIHQTLGSLRYLRRFLDEADAYLDEIL